MGLSKASFSLLLLATLFVSMLLLRADGHAGEVGAEEYDSMADSVPKIDCDKECARRCSLASRHKMCLRACGTCCHRCSCVPPGTSGNRDVCACYARMTTHGGRLKCP